MTVRIIHGDCRDVLRTLPDESVHCIVTSPPYFGLRDYGVAGQMGLEESPDEFVAGMVAVFRECRRVLRADGTLWLNIGDSYANDGKWGGWSGGKHVKALHGRTSVGRRKVATGLKQKDLIGVPWMLAFALRADGWYLRQDIVWSKPNPMPESVGDRCTKAHEYVFLLSKSPRYYYDADAIAEQLAPAPAARRYSFARTTKTSAGARGQKAQHRPDREDVEYSGVRNRRSVWNVPTVPNKEAHFAMMPPGLAEPCILAGCPEGGTVLDPFGGAGTTGLVADRLRRDAILIELSATNTEIARTRIAGDAPLFTRVRHSQQDETNEVAAP